MQKTRTVLVPTAAVMVLLASASHGATISYTAVLNGASENPANASPATGTAVVTIDTTAHQLSVDVTFSSLLAAATAAHLHCCATPPTNTAVAVPLAGFPAVMSGTYSNVFDLTQTATYSATFLTANGGTAAGAEAGLAADLAGGTVYLNIHSSTYPGGEIRGYPVPPDLTISKTHGGDFRQGQTGEQYTITVTNSGGGATTGTVTVTDTLPAGLTATSFGGSGWTCSALPALSCSRSDVLNGGNSYPDITLVVDVAADAPPSVTNTASVAGGGEADSTNDSVDNATTIVQTIPLLDRRGLALLGALFALLGMNALRRTD